MSRLASGLIAGLALGAVGAYFYLVGGAELGITPDVAVGSKRSAPSAVVQPSEPTLSTAARFSERSAVYQLAADADSASLRALIEEGAARPESAERRFLLATLLARYAEFSPREAIALADDLELDNAILASLYGSWVGTDPEAALDAWSHSNGAREGYAIGLAMFEVLGGDEQAFSSLLTSLPPTLDAGRFQTELIELWVQTAPESAFRKTLTLDRRSTRTKALETVAEAWSERDPLAALDALGWIDDSELRRTFEVSVLRGWSAFEPEAALEHIIAAEYKHLGRLNLARPALREIAQSNPLRALEFADRLPGAGAHRGRGVVLQAWAMDDVNGAIAYVETLPRGQRRQELQVGIGYAYAGHDPEAAFEWARNLAPHSGVLDAVVRGIARTDPERALDAVLTLDSEEAQLNNLIMSITGSVSYSGDPEALATRLTSLPEGYLQDHVLRNLTANWASTDPESALVWLLANADQASASASASASGFREVAEWLGGTDPVAAAGYTNKVPSAHRQAWIESIATGYARVGRPAALDWISQFQGEPAYERAMASLIVQWSDEDPQSAVGKLEEMGDFAHAERAARSIARIWVHADPSAAAKWAQEFEGKARSAAINTVAESWVGSDPQGAQSWVLGLPAYSDRDNGLRAIVLKITESNMPDAALWTAFSSDTARDEVLPLAAFRVATWDMDAARMLVEKYASDAGTRGRAEEYIKRAQ